MAVAPLPIIIAYQPLAPALPGIRRFNIYYNSYYNRGEMLSHSHNDPNWEYSIEVKNNVVYILEKPVNSGLLENLPHIIETTLVIPEEYVSGLCTYRGNAIDLTGKKHQIGRLALKFRRNCNCAFEPQIF